MSENRYVGEIKHVFNNYGIVSSKIDDTEVSFFFFITPDMLYRGKDLRISRNVTFKLVNSQIRNVKVKIATELKSCPNTKNKKYQISKKKIDKIEDYHDYIFKHFYNETSESVLGSLKEEDIKFKEKVLKWVLKIEKIIKSQLVKLLSENSIKSEEVYSVIDQDRGLKILKEKIFKTLKSRYIFRAEFELLKIDRSKDGNSASIDIIDVPLTLFFENLTIDELGKIYKYIMEAFDKRLNKSSKIYEFLNYNKQMFSEISIIRNSSAHGNPFIPLILDDSYSPSFLFDLKSVWPSHNSGNNVEEEWELFETIRFSTRMLSKEGIAPINIGSPLLIALYTTKYILINPARRSFFSFLFTIICYFKVIDNTDEKAFYNDMYKFMPIPIDDEEFNNDSLLMNYPKGDSVMKQLFIFTYVLFSPVFWFCLPITYKK
ncbi:Abi family protein [Streptococcus entericus]|uniref:Abi family protein n=1 Tax=Streptococcus entericus TaxID=155680 RepID=UPI0011EA65F4|nr:Abi family protein [Streptococcus entericus]